MGANTWLKRNSINVKYEQISRCPIWEQRRKVTEKSIIIIGAGLAGLSTGCYGQMNGYQCNIFEHHSVPGGVATAWKRKDYNIDGGIHFIMGHKPGKTTYELYRELGIAQVTSFVDMITYGRFVDETSGRSIKVTQDLNNLADDLKRFSPVDAHIIDELIAGAHAMQEFDMGKAGMSKPPELKSLLEKLKEMWYMRRLFKYFYGKYADPVADYAKAIQDPWLREFIKNLFLPEVPVSFIFMILGLLADGQLGVIEEGCLSFVQPIEKRYKDLGGEVTYKANVEEIIVKNDRAVGVRLVDGSEHFADIVISAADGYNTIFKLLGGHYVNEKIKNRYNNWELTRPLVMVSFGVAREFTNEPWMSTIILEHPITTGKKSINTISIRIFNYSTRFSPPGKTVVQVLFETEWDFWKELQRDRQHYEVEKENVAAEVLNRLEAHYSGISSLVEMTDVATPCTWWRYTRNHEGAYMGWLLTPEVLNTQIEMTLPGLNTFYMAGQWAMSGGGVLSSFYSGRYVIQLLCHLDRKPFLVSLDKSGRI